MDETLRQDATRSSLNDVPTLPHSGHDLTKENLPPEANELRKQGFLDQLLETLACKPSVTFQFQTSDSYPDEAFGRQETEGYRCQSHYVDRSGQFAMSQLYGEIAPRRVQTITDTRYSVSCSDFIAIIFRSTFSDTMRSNRLDGCCFHSGTDRYSSQSSLVVRSLQGTDTFDLSRNEYEKLAAALNRCPKQTA